MFILSNRNDSIVTTSSRIHLKELLVKLLLSNNIVSNKFYLVIRIELFRIIFYHIISDLLTLIFLLLVEQDKPHILPPSLKTHKKDVDTCRIHIYRMCRIVTYSSTEISNNLKDVLRKLVSLEVVSLIMIGHICCVIKKISE